MLVCGSVFYTCEFVIYIVSGFTRVDPYFTPWIHILHVWIRILHVWIRILHRGSVFYTRRSVFHILCTCTAVEAVRRGPVHSPRQPGFQLRSVHLGCMVESVVLARVFSEYSSFSCQRHFANAPYLSDHPSHTLYNINSCKRC
jgi:hypothetical protein